MAVHKTVRRPDYSDLDLDFIANPQTGDIVKKTGVDAIKRSMRNLILTNYYDRPFRPFIGSSAQRMLFDNMNILTSQFLHDAIVEVITNFEPRVSLTNDNRVDSSPLFQTGVTVTMDEDRNGYNATISFTILNSGLPATINVFLERLR